MSFQDKLWELVNRLFSGTTKGQIRWSETADEGSFRTLFNTGLVRVERQLVANGSDDEIIARNDGYQYAFVVLDDRNKEIARYLPDGPEHALTLRNLWELAQRSALNAESKIDRILQEVAGKESR